MRYLLHDIRRWKNMSTFWLWSQYWAFPLCQKCKINSSEQFCTFYLSFVLRLTFQPCPLVFLRSWADLSGLKFCNSLNPLPHSQNDWLLVNSLSGEFKKRDRIILLFFHLRGPNPSDLKFASTLYISTRSNSTPFQTYVTYSRLKVILLCHFQVDDWATLSFPTISCSGHAHVYEVALPLVSLTPQGHIVVRKTLGSVLACSSFQLGDWFKRRLAVKILSVHRFSVKPCRG